MIRHAKVQAYVVLTGMIFVSVLAFVSAMFISSTAGASNYPGPQGRIVFSTNRDGDYEIYAMNPDGSHPRNLTNSPTTHDRSPVVSPDGKKIAYVVNAATSSIWVMDADGSNQTQITTIDSAYPDWSPDGSKILFSSGTSGGWWIYSMNPDGSDIQPVIDADYSLMPSWSPDGSTIAYSYGDTRSDIYLANADGTNRRSLTNNASNTRAEHPNWSPDGSQIAYSFEGNAYGIYTMNSDGSNPTRISDDSILATRPVWSPDGSKIVYSQSPASDGFDVMVVNPDGSSRVNLTNAASIYDSMDPFWSTIPLLLPPEAPINVQAVANGEHQIDISWTAPTMAIESYRIERSTAGGPFEVIVADTGNTDTTYQDTGLAANTTYTYRVSAINSLGISSPSNTATVTTAAAINPGSNPNPNPSSNPNTNIDSGTDTSSALADTGSNAVLLTIVGTLCAIGSATLLWRLARRH